MSNESKIETQTAYPGAENAPVREDTPVQLATNVCPLLYLYFFPDNLSGFSLFPTQSPNDFLYRNTGGQYDTARQRYP
ncbi:hypothetical protein EV102420_14_00140 [Pseudescherichia vulneris NBRC 102420]|uniref:Uncharacterized protein n=1 Tax=Pseudescherichia vulneris NBRC 102420 TaxID=1115515 RepID=A0A090V260_PSEVU|nr:hypothetical protein EV102420_14_00140 [Pseudescherichia vulneris NBRC 102420]